MPIVGGLDIHRKQLTFDYLDTVTGEVKRGQVVPADRAHLRAWLARFAGRDDVAFALEGCTGWRYVAEELAGAGVAAHVAEPADTAFARGRKRHAKTDSRHLRELLAQGRLPSAGSRRRTSWSAGRCSSCITICGPSILPGCSASMRCSSTRALRLWATGRCAPDRAWPRCRRQRPLTCPRPVSCRPPPMEVIEALEAQMHAVPHQLLAAARHLAGAKVLAERLYGVGPMTALAMTCWLGGAGRFSSSRKAVRFAGLDITVYSSDGKRSPGRLSRQGPPVLRFSSALAVSGCIGVAFHRRSRRAGGAVVVPVLRLLSDARAGHGCGARHMDGLGSRCLAGERRRGGSPSAARTGMPARAVGG